MNVLKKILILFGCSILAGCSTTDSVRYDSQTRLAKKNGDEVEIQDSGAIKRKYKVIGLVECEEDSPKDALNELKSEAAKMGADAILDPHREGAGRTVAVPVGGIIAARTFERWLAKAIVWE